MAGRRRFAVWGCTGRLGVSGKGLICPYLSLRRVRPV